MTLQPYLKLMMIEFGCLCRSLSIKPVAPLSYLRAGLSIFLPVGQAHRYQSTSLLILIKHHFSHVILGIRAVFIRTHHCCGGGSLRFEAWK